MTGLFAMWLISYTTIFCSRAMERGRVKCGQYWPLDEEGEVQIEEFIIINTAIEQNREYSITGLLVHNTQVIIHCTNSIHQHGHRTEQRIFHHRIIGT